MVRAWAPDLIPMLDDNRLPAAHAEAHYMLGALCRGRGAWWLHPETQFWWGLERYLRSIHDLAVQEMIIRGYQHKSPAPGPRGDLGQFNYPETTRHQDYRDLWHKWTLEGRIRPSGHVWLGAVVLKQPDDVNAKVEWDDDTYGILSHEPIGELKLGRPVYGFLPPRRKYHTNVLMSMTDVLERHASMPPRVWGKEQREALRAQAIHRGPTSDLTEEEWRAYVDPEQYPYTPASLLGKR